MSDKSLEAGLKKKRQILAKKIQRMPTTHKDFKRVVKLFISTGQQQQALRRNGQ